MSRHRAVPNHIFVIVNKANEIKVKKGKKKILTKL